MEPGSGQAARRKTKAAPRMVAPGIGHYGPQLAGEDTEASRTRVQPKVAGLASISLALAASHPRDPHHPPQKPKLRRGPESKGSMPIKSMELSNPK